MKIIAGARLSSPIHSSGTCSGVLLTFTLTQTYCWCKSHSSHTTLLSSCHEYLNKYTYIPHCLTSSRMLLLAWSYVWIMPLSHGSATLDFYISGLSTLRSHIPIFDDKIYKTNICITHLTLFSPWGYRGHGEVTGCIHTNASLLTDRWHTSRPICSFTSTIKIHGSIFLCPVCQRCSVFFSVKWIKWAGCQKHCSFYTPDIAACLRLRYI